MPGTSSPHDTMTTRSKERFGQWLVSAPPLVYLLFFFAIPTLIMVLASFRTPGEFGGLAPLVEDGKLDLNVDSYARFFTESVYAQIFVKSVWYALLTTLFCLLLAYRSGLIRATEKFKLGIVAATGAIMVLGLATCGEECVAREGRAAVAAAAGTFGERFR